MATLGNENKYEVGGMFNNAIEAIEGYIETARENGLDAKIADKYNFHVGGDADDLVASDKPIYTDAELAAIEKCLKPAGYKDFIEALKAVDDEKAIQAEIERIRKYDDGNAITKSLVLYDIAKRRLRTQYEGDERFFKARQDNGETKYSLRKEVDDELLKRIATTPISENLTSLPGDNMYRHTTPMVEKANSIFNEELERQINDPKFPKDHV